MAEDDKTKTGEETKTAEERLAAAEAAAKAAAEDVAKWKAMSRKHEDQAKSNAEAAKKLKDAEDAQKSAEERAAARLAELEAKVNASDARAMRAEVAAAKSLTPAQARRLQGSTIEELEADADDLLASFKPADKGGEEQSDKDEQQDTGKPKEKLRSGATSGDVGEEKDLKDVLAAIPRA